MSQISLPARWREYVAAAAAVLSLVGVTIAVTDSNNDGKPDTVTVTVNQARHDGQPSTEVTAPAALVEAADPHVEDSLDGGATTPAQKDAVAEGHAKGNALPTAGAVQGFKGCVTRILPANYSSRPGVRPVWFVLHYTVSHNVAGWSDVNAIINLFSNPARQASSNFVIDAEGNCAYIVPIEAKAWTQAGGNPWSVSVEVIAYGDEDNYLGPAGWAKLRSVASQVSARTGIPLRRGSVAGGCVPGRAGIVQHKDFGLCGGGHVDITPFSVDSAVKVLTPKPNPLTKTERKIVRSAHQPKGTGHSEAYWRGRARERVRVFDAAHQRHPWSWHRIGARRARLVKVAA